MSKAERIRLRSLPWLTEGAIAFLEEFVTPTTNILEYGSGASTLWLAERCGRLVSIDSDPDWHDRIVSLCRQYDNTTALHRTEPVSVAEYDAESFDLLLIDGRQRVECFRKSEPLLKLGGYVMLDNSERRRYQQCFKWYASKQRWDDVQQGPDAFGFWYEGWTTTWWRK